MPRSVLDEIREGNWDFEPTDVDENHYDSTIALPGSNEKIDALAQRAEQGLPLWHSEDRLSYDETAEALV